MSVLTWRVLDKHSYRAFHFRLTPRNSRLNHGRDGGGGCREVGGEEGMGGRFCMCFDQRESWTVITRKLFPEVRP